MSSSFRTPLLAKLDAFVFFVFFNVTQCLLMLTAATTTLCVVASPLHVFLIVRATAVGHLHADGRCDAVREAEADVVVGGCGWHRPHLEANSSEVDDGLSSTASHLGAQQETHIIQIPDCIII